MKIDYLFAMTLEYSSAGSAKRKLAIQIPNIEQSKNPRDSFCLKGYIMARYLD